MWDVDPATFTQFAELARDGCNNDFFTYEQTTAVHKRA